MKKKKERKCLLPLTGDTKTTHREVCQNEEFIETQVPKLKVYFKKILKLFTKETTLI